MPPAHLRLDPDARRGVTPAGIFDYSRWYDQYPADAVAFLRPIPAIGQWGEPDLEKVAALNPDLIVGVHDELEPDVAAKLAKVAPTRCSPPRPAVTGRRCRPRSPTPPTPATR
jgi:ABC-type Fe3+-hydroxamate transport system substrate-binding protein